MKTLAVGILVLGAVALVTLLIPTAAGPSTFGVAFEHRPYVGAMLLLGATLPVVLGCLALAFGPLRGYHAAIATAGFALVFVRLRAWTLFEVFGALELSMQALVVASIAGMAWSFVALVKAGP